MLTNKQYKLKIQKEFNLSDNSICYLRKKRGFNSNKELYYSLIEDREIVIFLQDRLIENKSHLLIKECFVGNNKTILAYQFVLTLFMQDIDKPIQNQFRQTMRRVKAFLDGKNKNEA